MIPTKKPTYARTRSMVIALILLLFGSASKSNGALIITANFISSGNSFPGGLGVATGAPGNAVGGGTLQAIFTAAAAVWEAAYPNVTHSLTLSYGWQALGGGTLGVHVLTGQGGSPNRETAGVIRFDSDGSSLFFLDPTPLDNSEYTTFTQSSANLGGGVINTGRVYTGATGAALGTYDLFSVALHEIGHALGLSSANTSFIAENGDLDIDVTAPRAFPGSTIPTISGAHINITSSLMYPFASPSQREYVSAVDILANAQISQFNDPNFNPQVNQAAAIPEPPTWVLAGLCFGLIAVGTRLIGRRREFPTAA